MYDEGAEIIYHASGASGAGLFNAAVEADKYAIGVDSDQYLTASPEQQPLILTSMLKRVDVAVYNAIDQVGSGTFAAGHAVFGMAEDGVDYSTVEHRRADAGHHRRSWRQRKPQIIYGRHRRPRGPDQGLIRKADERMTNEHGAGRGSAPPSSCSNTSSSGSRCARERRCLIGAPCRRGPRARSARTARGSPR